MTIPITRPKNQPIIRALMISLIGCPFRCGPGTTRPRLFLGPDKNLVATIHTLEIRALVLEIAIPPIRVSLSAIRTLLRQAHALRQRLGWHQLRLFQKPLPPISDHALEIVILQASHDQGF